MSGQLYHDARIADAGNRRPVKSGSLQTATMNAGNAVTVWAKQVPADKSLGHGAGTDNRQVGRNAPTYADLVASGDGTGTAGDAIEGDLVAVITDSEQRDVIERTVIGDLETLADAADDARTERPLFPAQVPLASESKHLEYRIVADDASDGVELDPSASSMRCYYTDISL